MTAWIEVPVDGLDTPQWVERSSLRRIRKTTTPCRWPVLSCAASTCYTIEAAAYRVKMPGDAFGKEGRDGPWVLELKAAATEKDCEEGCSPRFPTWEEAEEAASDLLPPGVVLTAVLISGEQEGRDPEGASRARGLRFQQVGEMRRTDARVIRP